jgi:radical SAM family uncharacterized protein
MTEDLLLNVHRPAQYLGNEWNACRKDPDACAITFALGFPDLYEIGMSNLGMRIIYGLLNNIPDVACERFFTPEKDMEEALKSSQRRLCSWESDKELRAFDIAGFSLGSELNYTNVLNILDLAGIPLQSSSRGRSFPLVVAGGPCALNPEPMADFFDLFIIGEAEEAAVELLEIYRRHKDAYKSGGLAKEGLLLEMSRVEGVYAPSLYDAQYESAGKLRSFSPRVYAEGGAAAPRRVKKRVVGDLNSVFFPRDWVVPYVQTVHDRVTLEIMRGCPNRCRFCQARSQYYPFRIRAKEQVVSLADAAYASSGYEEISLAGLSVSDYPGIENLVSELICRFKDQAVNLSLPSLKAKALLGNVSTLIAKIKKTGLTFAPEAGTERMRRALAKDFSEEDFFQAAQEAFRAGYQHLKLYFLIGLPGENEEDLDGIIEFSHAASELKRKVNGSGAQINISVNPLIPKPHTPLQWLGMEGLDTLKQKQLYLRNRCRNKRLKLGFHNFEMAMLEAVLSRGDRLLGRVILSAYMKGARFDAWPDSFSLSRWQEAFSEQGIDPQAYLKERDLAEPLPWDFIDTGVKKEYLAGEFKEAHPAVRQ